MRKRSFAASRSSAPAVSPPRSNRLHVNSCCGFDLWGCWDPILFFLHPIRLPFLPGGLETLRGWHFCTLALCVNYSCVVCVVTRSLRFLLPILLTFFIFLLFWKHMHSADLNLLGGKYDLLLTLIYVCVVPTLFTSTSNGNESVWGWPPVGPLVPPTDAH